MPDSFFGLDLNGVVDRCLSVEWPSRTLIKEAIVARGIVVRPIAKDPLLVGKAAKLSPIARGWTFPRGSQGGGTRHNVGSLLCDLKEKSIEPAIGDLLAAHARHLVGAATEVGLVVPDDFGAGAQTRFLDVARRASRFEPGRGWIGWKPYPVWRSVSVAFAWASRLEPGRLVNLRGRCLRIVSMLDDRLTVSPLQIDCECADGMDLLTPVRHTAGISSPRHYAPHLAETEALALIGDLAVRKQVEAVAGAADIARDAGRSLVLQRTDGTWYEGAGPTDGGSSLANVLREREQRDIDFLLSQIDAQDIVLIDCPDGDRRFREMVWSSRYAKAIATAQQRPLGEVVILEPGDAACGAGEFVARIAKNLPTYFDHIHGIEILALNEDGDGHDFIPLFPEARRVPGNMEFKQVLRGRFAVQASSAKLTFHLWRQDDPDNVRTSTTEFDRLADDLTPIALVVTQRPVSGYATIEVLPENNSAFHNQRIVLDWDTTEVVAKSRGDIVAERDAKLQTSFPNHAPIYAHAIAWEVTRPLQAILDFLETDVGDKAFDDSAAALKKALGRRVGNPRYYKVDIDHPAHLFDGDGNPPESTDSDLFAKHDISALVMQVREKIDEDMRLMKGARAWRGVGGMPRSMSDLYLAGSWMYAGAPMMCVEYLRDVIGDAANIQKKVVSIGRVVSADSDIKDALAWLIARLRKRVDAKKGVTQELNSISKILQLRENAWQFLGEDDAHELAECSLGNLQTQLMAKGRDGRKLNLKFSFLYSAMAFLLVLRFRRKDSRFLEPPKRNSKASPFYLRSLALLQAAEKEVNRRYERDRTSVHRLAPKVVLDAIEFLQKIGRDPDTIVAIAKAEADDDDVEDGS